VVLPQVARGWYVRPHHVPLSDSTTFLCGPSQAGKDLEVIESCRRDTACKAKLDALPRNRSSLEYFGITEARAQTSPSFIILTPCNPPEIHVAGAQAYWFTEGGFQMNCPGSTHYLYRHWLGPTGDGPWMTAVIVAPTAEYYLFDVAYSHQTAQTCPNPNPAIPPLTTYLEMWDGSAYTSQASWTDDPCLQPPHRTTLVALRAGWNYFKFRVRFVANQPGHASFMGFTFYECGPRPRVCLITP
jgi:hypothetical protein